MHPISKQEHFIPTLSQLRNYLVSDGQEWQEVKLRAYQNNTWFSVQEIDAAVNAICKEYLEEEKLADWLLHYQPSNSVKNVGIVCAGNIPLVGFHDLLCGIVSGHNLQIKLSSKDQVLMTHVIHLLTSWNEDFAARIQVVERLENCDAYIATGSNNTARYFEYYFGKKPNIIRKNRTSVAVLSGDETEEQLKDLGQDVFRYYGLGCRNVTQLQVPEGYDFKPLLDVFAQWDSIMHHNKYKNNFDYHLTLYLMNRVPYLSNEVVLLVENELPYSAVSVLHYQYYKSPKELSETLKNDERIQAITGADYLPFGSAQKPSLMDYADGVDTMAFLCSL